jgi:hypothetical protein
VHALGACALVIDELPTTAILTLLPALEVHLKRALRIARKSVRLRSRYSSLELWIVSEEVTSLDCFSEPLAPASTATAP